MPAPRGTKGPSAAALGLVAFAVVLAPVGLAADDQPPRHVIYLHGRIVQEEQSARPRSPRFGFYEMASILAAFRDRGFAVTGEVRPKSASVGESADRVVAQVRRLLDSGVPADHVTVVGASMGAGIALVASARLENRDLRFAVLGTCLSTNVRAIRRSAERTPSGHVLSIREASDASTEPCPAWTEDQPSLETREILLQTGLSHGFLYRPLREWMDPVVEWALAKS